MKKKMTVTGVAIQISIVIVVCFIAATIISWQLKPVFRIVPDGLSFPLSITGFSLFAVGLALSSAASSSVRKAYNEDRLLKTGLYHVFRDPIYLFQTLIAVPGISLMLNSWLVLTTVIPSYIAYCVFVRKEHRYLEEKFGDEYIAYKKTILISFL